MYRRRITFSAPEVKYVGPSKDDIKRNEQPWMTTG